MSLADRFLRSFLITHIESMRDASSIGLSGSSTMRSGVAQVHDEPEGVWMAWQLDRDLYGPERPTVRISNL